MEPIVSDRKPLTEATNDEIEAIRYDHAHLFIDVPSGKLARCPSCGTWTLESGTVGQRPKRDGGLEEVAAMRRVVDERYGVLAVEGHGTIPAMLCPGCWSRTRAAAVQKQLVLEVPRMNEAIRSTAGQVAALEREHDDIEASLKRGNLSAPDLAWSVARLEDLARFIPIYKGTLAGHEADLKDLTERIKGGA